MRKEGGGEREREKKEESVRKEKMDNNRRDIPWKAKMIRGGPGVEDAPWA